VRDLTYPPIIMTAKGLFKALGLRFQMSGTEHIPAEGGALLSVNHVGYVDFVLAGFAAQPVHRLVRFMAKREVFDHPVGGPVMRSMHHISVDRADGIGSFKEAVRYLKEGELVGIFPEATISRSFEVKELKSGAVRIAASAGVPVIPVILWGTQRLMTKDHPRDFSRGKTIGIHVGEPMQTVRGKGEEQTAELHRRMTELLATAIAAYPDAEQPPGSWWLPASYGGSAPTPEEAARLDAEEKERRAARRAARDAS
jgi:1-acyl-sn-glycerol-3-phosphate acyltransferase